MPWSAWPPLAREQRYRPARAQSSLKQVIHNTESAIRQYDLRGKAVALDWDA